MAERDESIYLVPTENGYAYVKAGAQKVHKVTVETMENNNGQT